MHRSTPIPKEDHTSGSRGLTAVEPDELRPPSVSFGAKYVSVGPLPIGLDTASLEFVREIQAITCAARSLIALHDCRIHIHFEKIEDAITFLETWIFLVEQGELEAEDPPSAPIHLRLVKGLSQRTLLGLKQYLATFGRGGYLVVDEGNGLTFLFNDPVDAELVWQQFGRAFQGSGSPQRARS